MKVIGLTGGIASGKSTASAIIKKFGIPVIDADLIARELVGVGEPALDEIVEYFGKEVLNPDGTLNRKLLGSIVFSDPKKLEILNHITHRRIIERIENKIAMCKERGDHPVVFLDAALLIEMNMRKLVDEIWLISVEQDIQLKRLMERDGLSITEAKNRIHSQMPLEEKKKHADVIIDNSKDYLHLEKQIEGHLMRINR